MKHTITKKTLSTLVALSLSASFLTAGCGLASTKTAGKTETKPALTQEQQTKKAEAGMSAARNTPIVQAAKKVGPAVVGITNKALVRDYFNRTQLVEQGSGSGVIYSKDGLIATNNHVVAGAQEIVVSLPDGKTYTGKVLGTDPNTDLAVVKIEADGDLPVAEFGDSDSLMVGEPAIAIGNPLGMEFRGSVTAGVISALNRSLDMGERRFRLIQTDAAITAGNSGGGMFNVAGELIGIPSMKYTGSMFTGSTVEGIGMAIPINEAKDLINDVLSGNGNVEGSTSNSTQGSASISTGDKPRIGVTVSNLNPNSYAVAYNLIPTGAYVQDVESGSPAEKAGVQVADIVVEVDGTRVSSMEEMTAILQSKQAGDTATLKVYRVEGGLDSYEDQTSIPDGEYIDLTVELAMLDAAAQ